MPTKTHTPGPWSFRLYAHSDETLAQMHKHGIEVYRTILNDGSVVIMAGLGSDDVKRICQVDCQVAFKRGQGHRTEDDQERDANARLIAEAPAMHAALKDLVTLWLSNTITPKAIERAEAILAKVEGIISR